MHPIVMIAGDKDPAIGKAVEDLEAAGFEVRVLNSAKAKLVDFLGAIAGVDDEEDAVDDETADAAADELGAEDTPPEEEAPKPKKKDKPADDEAPVDEPPVEDAPVDDEAPAEEESDETDPLDPKNMLKQEATISGEVVKVEYVDGEDIVLHPSSITIAAKTFYALNESQFSFWPGAVSNEPITGGVELSLNGDPVTHLTKVIFSEQAMNPPVLKIGKDWKPSK